MTNGVNIRVSKEVHQLLVDHLKNTDRKIGKWTEFAIINAITRESKKPTA